MTFYFFTESKLDQSVSNEDIVIEDYCVDPIRKDRNSHGGGVLVYYKPHLLVTRREDIEIPVSNDEVIWVQIKFSHQLLLIALIYRPETSTVDFWSRLDYSVSLALDCTSNVILLGDLNIDFLKAPPRYVADMFRVYNLTNVITEPTRITSHSSTLLDPIIVSDTSFVLDSGVLTIDKSISDHCITFATLMFSTHYKSCFKRHVWNYKNADFDLLGSLLSDFDWLNHLDDTSNADEACEMFTSVFMSFVDRCVPSKEVLIRKKRQTLVLV